MEFSLLSPEKLARDLIRNPERILSEVSDPEIRKKLKSMIESGLAQALEIWLDPKNAELTDQALEFSSAFLDGRFNSVEQIREAAHETALEEAESILDDSSYDLPYEEFESERERLSEEIEDRLFEDLCEAEKSQIVTNIKEVLKEISEALALSSLKDKRKKSHLSKF